jgi:ribosomal protein S8E
MSVVMNAAAACDVDALSALEVVAKVGWLSKSAWEMSRAVHAFTKPINVKLTPAMSDAVKAGILSRSTVVKLQLEDNVTLISPLPLALQELALSDTISEYDKVPELPASLTKLDVTVGLVNDATALRSLM